MDNLIEDMLNDTEFLGSRTFFDCFGGEIDLHIELEIELKRMICEGKPGLFLEKSDVINWLEDYKIYKREKNINNLLK